MEVSLPRITARHREQFREEGYFFLERALSDVDLAALRDECDRWVEKTNADMDARGVTVDGINHRDKRYFIAHAHKESAVLRRFLFGDTMAEIAGAILGDDVYLLWEQFVVKAAEVGTKFAWHQDSGYIGHDHPPYLSCWCPLDDVDEDNGTVYILPFSRSGVRRRVEHVVEPGSNDRVGYFGDDPGIPAVLPAGGMAVFSSVTFHRSGPNTTRKPRREYLPQYSSRVIMNADHTEPWALSEPVLLQGRRAVGSV